MLSNLKMTYATTKDTYHRVTWKLQGRSGTTKNELIQLTRWTLTVNLERLCINVILICALMRIGSRDFALYCSTSASFFGFRAQRT